MTWGKMDDKFHRNRKVRSLRQKPGGREALGVWVFWWSWCLDDPDLTGHVPALELSAADTASAQLLVEVGLWDTVADGYAFHDFHAYNPTRDQVAHKREYDRQRAAAERQAKPESRSRVVNDSETTKRNSRFPRALPVPSRPVPSDQERERDALVDRISDELLSESAPPLATAPANELAERRDRNAGPPSGIVERRSDFDAQAQRVAFTKAYEAKIRTPPSMGGKHVAGFNAAVVRTAELQQRDPRELFGEVLSRWLARPHSEAERRAPYACFCQAWGELTGKGSTALLGASWAGVRGPLPPASAEEFTTRAKTDEEFEDQMREFFGASWDAKVAK
jgi:hypothetical protein